MPRQCAYCGGSEQLTKEHLWPTSITKRVHDRLRYTNREPKFFWGDPTIRDVCAACNNGPLSVLDQYGVELYDKYFTEYITDKSAVVHFEYDYQRLAKWLLKLSYNSARAASADQGTQSALAQYSDAILVPGKVLPDNFSIAVDVVLPSTNELLTIPPASNRLCDVRFDPPSTWCVVRLVAINSWYFWIVIQTIPDAEVDMDNARRVLSKIRGTRIDPDGNCMSVRPFGSTTVDMHQDWLSSSRAAWTELAKSSKPKR